MTNTSVTIHSAKTLKAFYGDSAFWLDGIYQDDVLLIVNGKESPDVDSSDLADDDLIRIDCGYLVIDGVELPAGHILAATNSHVTLDEALGLWIKGQTTRFLVIEHDTSVDLDALRAHLAAFHPSIKVVA